MPIEGNKPSPIRRAERSGYRGIVPEQPTPAAAPQDVKDTLNAEHQVAKGRYRYYRFGQTDPEVVAAALNAPLERSGIVRESKLDKIRRINERRYGNTEQ